VLAHELSTKFTDLRLKTGGLSGSDVKSLLEVLVQDIEKAVRKTPHEEEDGDKGYLMMSEILISTQEINVQG